MHSRFVSNDRELLSPQFYDEARDNFSPFVLHSKNLESIIKYRRDVADNKIVDYIEKW
ncbi:hypothetical protein [Mycoplasmopsis arginini]|uniref:hypothetical protein n=1 Tax=Mycoplasmopsis arginini TaxID=2094 RepID=UPI003D085F7C